MTNVASPLCHTTLLHEQNKLDEEFRANLKREISNCAPEEMNAVFRQLCASYKQQCRDLFNKYLEQHHGSMPEKAEWRSSICHRQQHEILSSRLKTSVKQWSGGKSMSAAIVVLTRSPAIVGGADKSATLEINFCFMSVASGEVPEARASYPRKVEYHTYAQHGDMCCMEEKTTHYSLSCSDGSFQERIRVQKWRVAACSHTRQTLFALSES